MIKNIFKSYLKQFDAILISSIPNIEYLTGFFGFTQMERECFLLITKNDNFLITDQRYSEAVKECTKEFKVIDIGAIKFLSEFNSKTFQNLKIKKLGIEKNNLTVLEFELLINNFQDLKNINLSNIRLIKSKNEIQNIKKACDITDQAFQFILNRFSLNKTEKEIETELELFIKKSGADISFRPIIAFDSNSSLPHHLSSNKKLNKNQIILMDFGVKFNGFCSDMTRTIFFGKADDKFKKIYNTVLIAQRIAIEKIKVGLNASEIDKAARNYILKNNYLNIIHSVGHGIGLEVHESPHISPTSNDMLKNGMIFSIEPGIYIPNYGGVRIEDLVLIENGIAQLISQAKREIIELDVK